MEFGIFDHLDRGPTPLNDFYRERLDLIDVYDRAGFYAYHLAEHHATPLGMAPSPSVFLAAVAARTRRLRFGPLVYALPLHHPLRLIEEICMLDQMSGGRLEIGFGRGASPIETALYGQKPAEAERIYAEALEVVLRGLTQPALDFHGEFFSYDGVPMELAPLQKPHPPVWYGVHSDDSAERAARRGLNIVSLDSAQKTRGFTERYRKVWRERRGESPAAPKLGIGRFIVVGGSDREALAVARRAYLVWHRSFNHLFRLRGGAPIHQRPPVFDDLPEAGQGIAGGPETVRAYLQSQLAESGANYLVGQFAFGDLSLEEALHSVKMFTRQVMPLLRKDEG
jgi:alkanesulfonate monooxygenase SsuD/methylene tetrahydromethanopterin reductase-like flavin-dependent oxidoreductase (luciferase family)